VSARLIRWFGIGALGLAAGMIASRPLTVSAQDTQISRKVKTRIPPMYPPLAKKMSIAGVVKVEVVVAPNGSVKSTKVVGGHPLLVDAAVDAVKKWKFEPASEESSGVVEFKFQPTD
jgi:TonB family protein